MLTLKILAGILLAAGFLTALGAKKIVTMFDLQQKVKIDSEYAMDKEEEEEHKMLKAVVNVKMIGMLIALPGIILALITFR